MWLIFSNGKATLRISRVGILDQGEYCCQATNSKGFQASKAELTVNGKSYMKTLTLYLNQMFLYLDFIEFNWLHTLGMFAYPCMVILEVLIL